MAQEAVVAKIRHFLVIIGMQGYADTQPNLEKVHPMPRRLALLPVALLLCSTTGWANQAYVANNSANTVSVIDTATNQVTATITTGTGPNGVSVTPDGTKAYVSNELDGTVSVISTATNTVLTTIQTGGAPQVSQVSPDGRTAYVADNDGNGIDVIDTATDTPRTKVTAAGAPVGLAVTPDGSLIYCADRYVNDVVVVSAQSLTVTATIPVGTTPLAIAFSPDGGTAYVTNGNFQGSGSVSVIDVATSTVTATIGVGNGPDGIAMTPDGTEILVANILDNSVTVIDTAAGAVKATLQLPGGATAVAVTPDGKTAYVAGGYVTPITIATGAVGAEIQVGPAPDAVAITPDPPVLVASILPGGRSVEAGTTATIFATMLNSGPFALYGCTVALPASAPSGLSLSYQTTNPATNALTGSANTPVGIAGGDGFQTFLLAFDSDGPVTVSALPLVFDCASTAPAAALTGVNTVDLLFSATPVPDIIALAATATADGTVHLTGDVGAFAVAADNAGIAGALTVAADTGDQTLPVALSLCQTDATGQCLAPPAASVQASIAAGGTPTFSVFVSASAPVPFAPGTSRVFIRFTDSGDVSHGSTSVAVTTD